MIQKTAILIIISFSAFVIGCASSSMKPGTGGKSSATEIETDAHPKFPDGVACYVCHKEDIPIHAFHKEFGKKCEQCHVLTTWMPQKYPHAAWPLNEVHNVRCTRCHTKAAEYDFASYQCYGCHHEEQAVKQSHANVKTNDITKCAECHKGFPEKKSDK